MPSPFHMYVGLLEYAFFWSIRGFAFFPYPIAIIGFCSTTPIGPNLPPYTDEIPGS